MSIAEQISGAAEKLQDQVRGYRASAVDKARARVSKAAEVVAASRTPIGTLVEATQRFNDLTHESFAQLLKQQATTIDGVIGEGVERLKGLAQAEDLKSFVRKQADLNVAARERVARDLKGLWSIAARTGRDIGTLASETYSDLIQGAKTGAKPAPRRKTARKTAKKTAN